MCDQQRRNIRESIIKQEAASKAINKTNAMMADAAGVSVPSVGTPSENRKALVEIIRGLALGP